MAERMNEAEKQSAATPERLALYSLRQATTEDLPLLFEASKDGLKPDDAPQKYAEYIAKFAPEKIQVILHDGKSVGRLRVVRSPSSIYVGGIQLLPAFRGMGIGTALFNDLIAEANREHIPIELEVYDTNSNAMKFYKKLGFVESGKTAEQTKMTYHPKD